MTNNNGSSSAGFGFSPESAKIQLGQALSGAGNGKRTTFSAAEDNRDDAKKEGDKNRKVFAMTMQQITAAYAKLGEKIEDLGEAVKEVGEQLSELTTVAKALLDDLDKNITDTEERLSAQKAELSELEKNLKTTPDSEKEYQQALIDSKKAEIKNSEAAQDLYKELRTSTSESLDKANNEFGLAQSSLADLMKQKHDAEQSGDPEGQLEDLKRSITAAEQNVQKAQETIETIKNNTELRSNIITFSKGDLDITGVISSCGTLEHEQEKVAMIETRTNLTAAITVAINDNEISEAEASNLMALSTKAGVTSENQMIFAKNIAAAGVIIQTKDGPLSGEEAQTYILNAFDELGQEKQQKLEETKGQIFDTEAQVDLTQSEIAQQQENLDTSTTALNTMIAGGNEAEQRSIYLGASSVGNSQSLAIPVIKDINGNEVHIDRSGDTPSYYHIDENGEHTQYAQDDPQVANFTKGVDGGGDMSLLLSQSQASQAMSSSAFGATPQSSLLGIQSPSETVINKKFANETVSEEAYKARLGQEDAQESIASNKLTLETLNTTIDDLKNEGSLLEGDIGKINEIERQIAANEISIQEANAQLKEFQSTNTTDTKHTDQETNDYTLDTPKITPEEYDAAYNQALEQIELAALNGVPLSPDQYDVLKASPVANHIDDMLLENGVEIGSPNITTDYSSVPSFADGDFNKTNPVSGPTPTYVGAADSHPPTLSLVSSGFGTGTNPDELEAERLAQEELRLKLEQQDTLKFPMHMG